MKIVTHKIEQNVQQEQKLINIIGDLNWILIDDTNELSIELNWSMHEIPSHKLAFYQSYFLELCGGYADERNRIYCTKNKAKSNLVMLEKISTYAEVNHSNKLLSQWTFEQVVEMMRHLIVVNEKKKQLYSRGEAATFISSLKSLQKYYLDGSISDGFDCDFPYNIFEVAYRPVVESFGLNFFKWKKGGSWGGVPISVSMLLLADCLKVINSKETKMLVALFDDLRIHQDFSYGYLIDKKALHQYVTKSYRNPPEKMNQYERLVTSIENATCEPLTSFPFSSGELSTKVKNIYDAGLMILLQLTGGRISEIVKIKANWIEPDQKGDWWFTSKIQKTNHGIKTVRSIAGIAGKVVDILIRLSLWDKKEHSLPILSIPFAKTDQKILNTWHHNACLSTWRQRLLKYYDGFLERAGDEVAALHPKFKPHQCRHTWAEFALRRFDGNVLEQIRHHFRHSYDSYFTRKYTDEKLTPEIQNALEREYLEEMILRIAHDDTNSKFHGKVALYIKKIINTKMKFYGIDEIDEMEEQIVAELADEFSRLVPHEWGYCLLKTATQTIAKCFDKETKIPMIDEGSSFDHCSGCSHRLTQDSQKEDITRIAISHNDFLNNFPIKILAQTSKETLKRASFMLKEIECEPV